jgi:hypothetical protein
MMALDLTTENGRNQAKNGAEYIRKLLTLDLDQRILDMPSIRYWSIVIIHFYSIDWVQ